MTDFNSDFIKDFDPEWKQKSAPSAAEDDVANAIPTWKLFEEDRNLLKKLEYPRVLTQHAGRLLHRWGEVYDDAQ